MTRLEYSRAELLQEHPYARPHEEYGYRLHGGFDASGRYLSPRQLLRAAAVAAWQRHLMERGWPLLDADRRLLTHGTYPCFAQQKVLLTHGLERSLWNALSITGLVEGQGRVLCDLQAPDFQAIVDDDLRGTALGHLNGGLLYAHGLDEGGDPATGLGGHDAMWFAVRDAVLGADAFPLPEIPPTVSRPESQARHLPALPPEHEGLILLLMNVLMIEVRAESTFDLNVRLFRDDELFLGRRSAAEHAAVMVGRIRQDEQVHIGYLRTVLSELRPFTLRTAEGTTVPGHVLLDPLWEAMVHWHADVQPLLVRQRSLEALDKSLAEHPAGAAILRAFLAAEAPSLRAAPAPAAD